MEMSEANITTPFDSEEDPLAGLFPEYEQLKQAVQTKDLSLVDATLSEIMRGAPKEILADFSRAISDAIGLNAVDIVQYLVDQQVPVDGDVVQTAVEASSIESLRILLPHWDINQVVRSGSTTALSFAVHDEVMVEWLLDNGADPNAESDVDFTPLSSAALSADKSVIDILLKRGGNPKRGQLFHCVAARLELEIAIPETLFKAGAPIDEIEYADHPGSWQLRWDFKRGTPLHKACTVGNVLVAQFLLDKGVDLQKLNTRGQTPLDVAHQRGQDEVVKMLERAKSNVKL